MRQRELIRRSEATRLVRRPLAHIERHQLTWADVTGPVDAKKAIVVIYDIFGYFDQTLQGADILAFSDAHQKYKVFIPDWFKGSPCPIEM